MYPHTIRHTFCSHCFEAGMQPPKWCRALWGTSITAQPLISIPMCRRAGIRKRLESLEGLWSRKKRKVKNLRKNSLSGWDRHLGEDMGAVLLLGSGLHILKEISYDWCGSEKKRERVHGQRHPDNYRRQSLFLNLFHQKI